MTYHLFDTSVWIDYKNGVKSAQTDLLDDSLITDLVCYCPTILQELLQGIRNDRDMNETVDAFKALLPLTLDPYIASFDAAQLYRSLRKKGVTIRKANDCLIAAYAIHFDIELCHNDSDFDLIAENSTLKIWKPI
ncbi:type II toxin-antitoxin system VapC family toxin [Dyadobacter psychrotolerans]|uniref:Ribonuclease VapC n=1 Tax=Dyadobacter psychrotolerans TaxID=2541721 RepID=A0A4R5DVA9_9BACT|nr:PIN domain-containing protein [Dyadobacter psychrotolerans]TDE18476.1 PIN domain nuclease [Dyadobacter psychrotolerans]